MPYLKSWFLITGYTRVIISILRHTYGRGSLQPQNSKLLPRQKVDLNLVVRNSCFLIQFATVVQDNTNF